jgi:hypothetical protein
MLRQQPRLEIVVRDFPENVEVRDAPGLSPLQYCRHELLPELRIHMPGRVDAKAVDAKAVDP